MRAFGSALSADAHPIQVRRRITYEGKLAPPGTAPTFEQSQLTALTFDEVSHAPRNPHGRTGMSGRGLLGLWGPNHAADPIVTRWDPSDRNRLQMVAIQRKDTGEWAVCALGFEPANLPGSCAL